MTPIIALVVVAVIAYRLMTPEERVRALRAAEDAGWRVWNWAKEYGRPDLEPFRAALRARTSYVFVTLALVALNIAMYLAALFDPSGSSGPMALVGWGGNFGPRTTNGEWWRLITAMFVHQGTLSLLINMAALLQVGLILERIVGPLAFVTAYVAAGVFAGLASLGMYPVMVSAGPSGAVFGLYGLLIATVVAGWFDRSPVTLPLAALVRLAPVTVVFVLYNGFGGGLGTNADLVGLAAGLVAGLVAAKGLSDHPPPARRMAQALAASLAIAVATAIPLRGIADVRPEIERLVSLEHHTASVYEAASGEFRAGKMSAAQLADLIEHRIIPELQRADARITALRGVRGDDGRRIADARQYLRSRVESWQLRVDGLRESGILLGSSKAAEEPDATFRARAEARHRSTTRLFAKAEQAERESLAALDRIEP